MVLLADAYLQHRLLAQSCKREIILSLDSIIVSYSQLKLVSFGPRSRHG